MGLEHERFAIKLYFFKLILFENYTVNPVVALSLKL